MNLHVFHFQEWLLSVLAALAVGMSKAGFAGVGIVPIVLMAHVLPTKDSTGVILPMLIVGDILAVLLFWRHTIWQHVLHLLPTAIVGVLFGAWLMNRIPSAIFGHVLGGLILLITVLMFFQRIFGEQIFRLAQHPGVALPAGVLTGITTMLANASGPIMTVYLLACKLPKMQFVGTLAWFYFLLNLSKTPFSAGMGLIDSQSLTLNLILAPAVLMGAWVGRRFVNSVSQIVYERMLLVLTFLGGLKLLISG